MIFDDEHNHHYEVGKVIVAIHKKLASSVGAGQAIYLLDELDYEKAEYIFHAERAKDKSGGLDILLLHLNSKDKKAVIDAIEKLSTNPYVTYAEPDYLEDLHVIPNDPLYKELWGM